MIPRRRRPAAPGAPQIGGIPITDKRGMKEDERIRMAGQMVVQKGLVVGLVVSDTEGTAARYVRKLKTWFPALAASIDSAQAPAGMVIIRVAPPPVGSN